MAVLVAEHLHRLGLHITKLGKVLRDKEMLAVFQRVFYQAEVAVEQGLMVYHHLAHQYQATEVRVFRLQ